MGEKEIHKTQPLPVTLGAAGRLCDWTGGGSFPPHPSPTHVPEHLAASISLALSKPLVPVTSPPGYLLLNQIIWKKDPNAFKTQRNVFIIAEDSRDMTFKS